MGRLRRGDMLPNQGILPRVHDLDGSLGMPGPPHTPAATQLGEAWRIVPLWGLAVVGLQCALRRQRLALVRWPL